MTEAEILAAPSGVSYTSPPAEILPQVTGQITAALAQLKPGSKGALVAIATESGVNGAIVAKLPAGWTTMAWIGKAWSTGAVYGAAVRKEW